MAFVGVLSILGIFVSITGLIYCAIKKKPKMIWGIGLVSCFVLTIFAVSNYEPTEITTPATTESVQSQRVTGLENESKNESSPGIIEITDSVIFGAPVDNFKKAYGELKEQNNSKENHNWNFIKNNLKIEGNWGNPETVQQLSLDLRERYPNGKLVSPEQFPVQDMENVEGVIKKFLPPDAKLIEERIYKDPTSPLNHRRVYRIYESDWIGRNLIPFAPLSRNEINLLPKNQFKVIIDKVDRGYLEIIFSCLPIEVTGNWSEIDTIDE